MHKLTKHQYYLHAMSMKSARIRQDEWMYMEHLGLAYRDELSILLIPLMKHQYNYNIELQASYDYITINSENKKVQH